MWTEQSVIAYSESKGVAILWELPQPPLAYFSIKLAKGASWSDTAMGIAKITDQRAMQRIIDTIDILSECGLT